MDILQELDEMDAIERWKKKYSNRKIDYKGLYLTLKLDLEIIEKKAHEIAMSRYDDREFFSLAELIKEMLDRTTKGYLEEKYLAEERTAEQAKAGSEADG